MSAAQDDAAEASKCRSLHEAAARGLVGAARHFLRRPSRVQMREGSGGQLPLHRAAEYGHVAVAELLLHSGAPVDGRTHNGTTALHLAAMHDHLDVARLLLRWGSQVEAPDQDGWRPLHLAARNGHVALAEVLLAEGARAEATTAQGATALHGAAAGGHVAVVELLVEKGANVQAKDRDGLTPLHWAAQFGREELAEMLLRQGARLEADSHGETPIGRARRFSQLGLVQLLDAGLRASSQAGKLREKLQGLYTQWQRVGRSLLPLVRLYFVGRGRAGKTTTLRCLKGETPKLDEKSTHGVELWAGEFQDLGTGEWSCYKDSVFEQCAVKGLKELAKQEPLEPEWRPLASPRSAPQLRALGQAPPAPPVPPVPAKAAPARLKESARGDEAEVRKVVEKVEEQEVKVGEKVGEKVEEREKVEKKEQAEKIQKAEQVRVELKVKEPESLGPARMHEDLEAAVGQDDNGLKLRLQCWDCPGQQEYALLNLLYFHRGIYVVVCDMSQELDMEWPHLSFWLWSITQHAASAPILLVGTKMGSQKISEHDLDEKIQDLMRRVPALKQQLQLGPRSRTEGTGSKWLFPMENIPRKDEELWQLCAREVRERIEEIAMQMVTPREQYPQESDVPDFVGSHAELYPVPWLRAYDLLAELGDGFQATLLERSFKRCGPVTLSEDLLVRHSKSGVTLRAPAGSLLTPLGDGGEVLVQCNFLSLEAVRGLLGGIQPQGVHGEDVEAVLRQLNDLGVLVWFPERGLADLVMLNPRVVAAGLADLMTLGFGASNFAHGEEYNASLQSKKDGIAMSELTRYQTSGVATATLLRKLWKDFDAQQQELLREVLLRRKLLVRRAVKDEFLVPCCLPLAHVPEAARPGDEVWYVDIAGVVSPNLFPMLAERMNAVPGKSRVLKPGPPQVFRNRLEASAGGHRASLSLFPLTAQHGWLVRICVEGQPGKRPQRVARSIQEHLQEVMGFQGLETSDVREVLGLQVAAEDLESFCARTPCLRSQCMTACSHCKLQWLVRERQQEDMSGELREVVRQISLQDVRPAGSFRFQSVAFPGDVDIYEYLVFEVQNVDEALEELSRRLQSLAKHLESSKILFKGLKAGCWQGRGMTWQLKELEAGEKQGIRLPTALKEGHATGTAKLDVYAQVPLFEGGPRRFVEITNVFRLGYAAVSQIEPITSENDHLRAVERDLRTYSGPHPRAMKFVKRLWERSSFLAQRGFDLDWHVKILEAIHPIFQHWAAKLGAVADHMETLQSMLAHENELMRRAALGDVSNLCSSLECLRMELVEVIEESEQEQLLEASEGLKAIREAKRQLAELPSDLQEMEMKGVSSLGRAHGALTACLETVVIHQISCLPALAGVKDWDLPGHHLPVGARLTLHGAEVVVALWVPDPSLPMDQKDESLLLAKILGMLRSKDILCLSWQAPLRLLQQKLPKGWALQSFRDMPEVVIYNERLSMEKAVCHRGGAAYKCDPTRAVVEVIFKVSKEQISFRLVFTRLPEAPFGPARRELARSLGGWEPMETVLLGALSFPDEAVRPLLVNNGLDAEFLEIPYPTTICKGSFLPKRTESIAVIPSSKVTGRALAAEEVMEGLERIVEQLNLRPARAPTPVRFMSDQD